MDLFQELWGWVRIRYLSADPGLLLAELEKKMIPVYDIMCFDDVTLEYSVSSSYLKQIKALADKRGERCKIIGRSGMFWSVKSILNRTVLLGGLLILLLITIVLPGRILFVKVEGNILVPEREILEAAEEAGLKLGAVRRNIRSEQIKNQLLDTVSGLKWAGVNTYGSRAVITVRERTDADEEDDSFGVRHIVAKQDGVITSSIVTAGCGVCTVGQAVKEGDVLISGYTDCGRVVRAERAEGTVFAETKRNLTVRIPNTRLVRVGNGEERVHYSLIIGKKRINFYKGSGISGGSCVKMSTEYVLTLSGGFELPLTLVKDRIGDYSLAIADVTDPQQYLEQFATGYLEEQMVSGTVTQKEEVVIQSDSSWILEGQYACIEDIGAELDEQIGDFHGKTDGADRECRPGG